MVARPRVLVLDDPTSGLDAASGREVIASSASFAAVVEPEDADAGISQAPCAGYQHDLHRDDPPAELRDVLALRQAPPPSRWPSHVQRIDWYARRSPRVGTHTDCAGSAAALDAYLEEIGRPIPLHSNPADHAIKVVNTEFYDPGTSSLSAQEHIDRLARIWRERTESVERESLERAGVEPVEESTSRFVPR